VTNQIFLVADNRTSGQLSHFYVQPEHTHVLAGSRVNITAAAVDSNYIPMKTNYKLKASDGRIKGNTLITPDETAEITVTAERNGMSLICVIMGAESRDVRNATATQLLDCCLLYFHHQF
jgi:hypothetical protein